MGEEIRDSEIVKRPFGIVGSVLHAGVDRIDHQVDSTLIGNHQLAQLRCRHPKTIRQLGEKSVLNIE